MTSDPTKRFPSLIEAPVHRVGRLVLSPARDTAFFQDRIVVRRAGVLRVEADVVASGVVVREPDVGHGTDREAWRDERDREDRGSNESWPHWDLPLKIATTCARESYRPDEAGGCLDCVSLAGTTRLERLHPSGATHLSVVSEARTHMKAIIATRSAIAVQQDEETYVHVLPPRLGVRYTAPQDM